MFARVARLSLLTALGVLLLAGPVQADTQTETQAVSDLTTSSIFVQHRFVTVGEHDGQPALRITAATKRKYRSRRIDSKCLTVGDDDPISFTGWQGDSTPVRDTNWLWVGRTSDLCQVQITVRRVEHHRHKGWTEVRRSTRRLRQTIAVTDAGRAYAERVRAASRMFTGVLFSSLAYDKKAHRYPLAPDLLAKFSWAAGFGLVAVGSADAVPPKGKVGVWTDGLHRLRVTFVLPDGTLLYHDSDDASHALSTNVESEIEDANALDGWWVDTYSSSSSSSASRR